MSRKPKALVPAPLEAKFAIHESTSTNPDYRFGNYKFCEIIQILFSLKNYEKNSHISETNRFHQSVLEARFATKEYPNSTSHY